MSTGLYYVTTILETLTNTRGINTSKPIKNIPSFPAYYGATGQPSRDAFLHRQVSLFIWEYLLLDLLCSLSFDQSGTYLSESLIYMHSGSWVEEWNILFKPLRMVVAFLVARTVLDLLHRGASILFVYTDVDRAGDWPPLFGSMFDIYSVRAFWGTSWHQLLRQPLTRSFNYLARKNDTRTPRPHPTEITSSSTLTHYTMLFLTFTLSGFLHQIGYLLLTISWPDTQHSMLFFWSCVLGIILEDSASQILFRLGFILSPSADAFSRFSWRRIAGNVWAATYLTIIASLFLEPVGSAIVEEMWSHVPLSVVGVLGVPVVASSIAAGAVVLGIWFQAFP